MSALQGSLFAQKKWGSYFGGETYENKKLADAVHADDYCVYDIVYAV